MLDTKGVGGGFTNGIAVDELLVMVVVEWKNRNEKMTGVRRRRFLFRNLSDFSQPERRYLRTSTFSIKTAFFPPGFLPEERSLKATDYGKRV